MPLGLLFLSSPFVYKLTKSYNIFAFTVFLSTISGVYFLIFTAGGLNAPGVFWVVATPILATVLLDRVGALLSIFMVFGVIFIFYYCDQNNIQYAFQFEYDYKKELLRNLLIFTFFFFTIFIYYINNEYKNFLTQKEQKDKIDNLLKIIIHDFSTPLSIIEMATKKLKYRDDTDSEYIQKINKNISNLSEMIKQIRSLKVFKDGKYNIKKKELNLHETLKESIGEMQPRLAEKNITLETSIQHDLLIKANKTILQFQILQNFLSNAIKFSPDSATIKLEAFSENNQAVIKIIDYGIGIPSEIIENIFVMNSKTSRLGTKGERGTGYGMPIAHEFLTSMGGTVSIESTEKNEFSKNHGTTFIIKFPLSI